MKKKYFSVAIVVAAVALAVIEFILLPSQVIVQIGYDGNASNVLPKFIAIIIPFALSSTGVFFFVNNKNENDRKYIIISAAGFIISILELIVNI